MSFKKKIKKIVATAALVTGLLQAPTCVNNTYHALAPSTVRQEFKERYDITLVGWSEDIEQEKTSMQIINQVITQEAYTQEPKIKRLRIRSRKYTEMGVQDLFAKLFITPFGGYYNPVARTIVLVTDDVPTLHHEIKHAKTDTIFRKYPTFLQRWQDLARDEDGKSLYLSVPEGFCRYVRGLEKIIEEEKKDTQENVRLGFVSNYARTNVFEDIAELCELAETQPSEFELWLYGTPEEQNQRIQQKVALAQEYGLLPFEFREYVALKKVLQKSYQGSTRSGQERYEQESAEEFLQKSATFVTTYPQSMYRGEIEYTRMGVLKTKRELSLTEEDLIEGYQAVLQAPYKGGWWYVAALESLQKTAEEQNEEDNRGSEVYLQAQEEYWRRQREGDLNLPLQGVNDWLQKRGAFGP